MHGTKFSIVYLYGYTNIDLTHSICQRPVFFVCLGILGVKCGETLIRWWGVGGWGDWGIGAVRELNAAVRIWNRIKLILILACCMWIKRSCTSVNLLRYSQLSVVDPERLFRTRIQPFKPIAVRPRPKKKNKYTRRTVYLI